MTIKEMIEVLQHAEKGGEVEEATHIADKWKYVQNPKWDFETFKYRPYVKSEKKTTVEEIEEAIEKAFAQIPPSTKASGVK